MGCVAPGGIKLLEIINSLD